MHNSSSLNRLFFMRFSVSKMLFYFLINTQRKDKGQAIQQIGSGIYKRENQ